MYHRIAPAILFSLLPLGVWAAPFAGVVDARDAADHVAVAPNAGTGGQGNFAPVSDARDTLKLAPPKAVPAAPIGERIAVTDPIEVPLPPTPTTSPTMPPLVKRDIPQQVIQAQPGTLLVQPASSLADIPAKMVDSRINNSGTISGKMFNDRTETLTPNGIVEDQPEPKDGFSFGGGIPAMPPVEVPPVAEPAVTAPVSPTAASVPPVSVLGPVKIISPLTPPSPSAPSPTIAVAPVSGTTPSPTTAAKVVPLAQPIAAGLNFTADDLTLSARHQQQLQTFAHLAHGNVLSKITITQRTVAPLNALDTLAGARAKAIVEALKAAGVISSQTKVSEVRVRSTGAASRVTLIGL